MGHHDGRRGKNGESNPTSNPRYNFSAVLCWALYVLILNNNNNKKKKKKKNFGLEKCARIYLKRGRVQSKMHIGSTFENDIKKLDPRKAYKYLGIEESFDIQHKNEKEKLKKEYSRRMRLVFGTELNA